MNKWILVPLIFLSHAFTASATFDEVVSQLDEVEFVHFGFTDILGNLKTITVPSHRAETALTEGLKFDGSSILGCSKISDSDMHLAPDLSTFKILPTCISPIPSALILCDIQLSETELFEGAPRTVLKKIQNELHEAGFELLCGTELEFYLLTQDNQTFDSLCYCSASATISASELKKNILKALIDAGIEVEKIHHEVAPGQFEIVTHYTNALHQADDIILAKYIIQLMADHYNLKATFLPKPLQGENGSGMHIHYSLYDLHNRNNAFYDSLQPVYLSDIAQLFLAGNIAYMEELISLTNSSINSYKRLVPGYEAPVFICWGAKNRSAMIRIPQVNADTAPKATRAEFRASDASSNPYLAFAALGISGFKGIEQNIPLPSPINQNIYSLSPLQLESCHVRSLPTTLEEAINLLRHSTIAHQFFNEQLLDQFLQIKQKEIDAYKILITDWEK